MAKRLDTWKNHNKEKEQIDAETIGDKNKFLICLDSKLNA
jgi:hypothetical protein